MGRVLKYIEERKSKYGALHMTLIDPDKVGDLSIISKLCRVIDEADSDAILLGGSTGVVESQLDEVIKEIRSYMSVPIILFPGSVAGLSRLADAVFFLSVLNSVDPYFITGAQAQAAIAIKRHYSNLEIIPTAYILMGDGGAAAYVSCARPIPYNRPELALAYALAAEFMGMKNVYLEAGSGASKPIPPEVISRVRSYTTVLLTVGGGIKSYEAAYVAAKAGADIVVTGTVIEHQPDKLKEIVKGVRDGGRERLRVQ